MPRWATPCVRSLVPALRGEIKRVLHPGAADQGQAIPQGRPSCDCAANSLQRIDRAPSPILLHPAWEDEEDARLRAHCESTAAVLPLDALVCRLPLAPRDAHLRPFARLQRASELYFREDY